MREAIDIKEAIRLYRFWQNWRLVAQKLPRSTSMPFAHDAVQAAVRNYDKAEQ